jgi:DNA invertase Pin-like site-specific DNA recombinase
MNGSTSTKRIALYLRVSSDKQTAECQRPECEALARARGDVVVTYEETQSAVKVRPEFQRMLADARRGAFDVLVIWSIDRFGRSMAGNLADAADLDRAGVQIVSVRESWLDTSAPTRPLLIAIMSWVAEQERNRLIERTNAGMRHARKFGTKSGKPIGRAQRFVDVAAARNMLAQGLSQRATAKAMGLPLGTLQRALARTAE